MAKALFITEKELKELTIVNGNVDPDKFRQYIDIAQEIHIQNLLGTKLYQRLQSDIIGGTLSGNYLNLLNIYVKPMTIHWAMVEWLPFAAYQINNGGVFKHQSENSVAAEKEEIDFLLQRQRDIADHYTRRFIDYICFNNNLFPEYNQNVNEDMHPDSKSDFAGWQL